MMSPARRRTAQVLRWFSLPLAVMALGGPLWSLASVYRHDAGKTVAEAKVLSARVTNGGSRGTGADYDLYVSYSVAGRAVRNNVRVNSYRSLGAGDSIKLFVDPATGDAEDDIRLGAWMMLGWGALA